MTAGLASLDRVPVRDQWAEIVDRAAQDADVVDLVWADPPPRHPRRTRVLAAVAASVVLLGTGVVVGRSTSHTRVVTRVPDESSAGGWTVGPSIDVPVPNRFALPFVAAEGGDVAAAFRGANQVVLANSAGHHRTVAVTGAVAAIASGTDAMGTPFNVVLTRTGDVLRVETSGAPVVVARLGAMSSEVGVAIAAGRVFVAAAGRPVLVVDGTRPPHSVGRVDASLLASDGKILWAVNATTGALERIDASTLRVTGTARVSDVVAMAADADGVYLARPGRAEINAVSANLSIRHVAELDPSTTAISVGGGTIWTAAFGVMRGYDTATGQVVATIARTSPQLTVAFDGVSTWSFGDFDGLRRLERTR